MGCSGILRDESGSTLVIFYSPLGITHSNVVEEEAICNALLCFISARRVGKRELIVEPDSKIEVTWVKNQSLRPWMLRDNFVDTGYRYEIQTGKVVICNTLCST